MKALVVLGFLSCASVASAQFVSLGNLTDGSTQAGAFPTGLQDGAVTSSTWHLWSFQANAGDNIHITVSRTAAALDPIAAAFLGDASGLGFTSEPLFLPANVALDLGLTLEGNGDDDVDDGFGGPFGDPDFSFVASGSGTFSVFVASFASLTSGPQMYDITVTGSTVPAPAALAMLGLGGLAATRRRR